MVRITEISLDGLHPQPPLRIQPRRVNLIYGRNEFGKTRLVEFLLSSLFHSSGKMGLRPLEASGQVKVNGLKGDEETVFNPHRRDKLEDYLGRGDANLPPQLARLLTVKGAESELQSDAPGGLSRSALNEYLSNQGLIDRIINRISKTVCQTKVQDGQIVGNFTGEIKKRKEFLDRLQVAEVLFGDLERQISGGPLAELTGREKDLESQLEALQLAHQHYVNKLAMDLKILEQQSDELPVQELSNLENDIHDEKYLLEEIARLENQVSQMNPSQEQYHWLEAAMKTYQVASITTETKIPLMFLGLAGLGLLAAVMFSFFNSPWVTLVFAVFTLVLGFLAFWQKRENGKSMVEIPENQRIEKEYERRFGKRFKGLTDLQVAKTALDREIDQIKLLEERSYEKRQRMQEVTARIENKLIQWKHLVGSEPSERNRIMQRLRERRTQLDDGFSQVKIGLSSTLVTPEAGGEVKDAEFHNPQKMNALEKEINQNRNLMDDIQNQKLTLKQRICDLTGKDISLDFPTLILALQDYRAELEKSAVAITAEILAGIAVHQAMQELRAGENETLKSALRSPIITNSLIAITGRYYQIDLNGEELEVSDDFQTFKLSALSTGAQEQVLLGLRIGLASRLFSGEPLFLILDDAFQHSDWMRRPAMVDEVLRLAKTGWQIFYLTMDDHLRDLFLERTRVGFENDFLFLSLDGK